MADAAPGPGADHGLRVRRDDAVLRLVLDRPQARNALTPALADRLAEVLEDTVADDDVRVVVLTGSGGAFSAGADVGEGSAALDEAALERANRIVRAVVRLDKPVVAAVNGVAAGFGCSLALAADLLLAAESASFLLPFSRLGLMPDGGATTTLAASLGRARTMRLALLAEPLPARTAYDAGLVSLLVPDDELAAATDEVARRLAAGPPLALAATKRAVNAATLVGPAGLDPALERERVGQTMLLRTADAAEGLTAFRERRAPDFRGS